MNKENVLKAIGVICGIAIAVMGIYMIISA